MRRLSLTLMLSLALGITACAQKRNNRAIQNNSSATGNFPAGESGETVVNFAGQSGQTADSDFVRNATETLNAVNPYPQNAGIPPTFNFHTNHYGVPSQGPQFGIPLLPGQFQPPIHGMVAFDQFPSMDFGDVLVGASVTRTLRVANFGRTAVMLLALQMNEDTAEITHVRNTCQQVLAPMAECSIELKFAPKQTGPRPRVLRLVYLKPDGSFDASYRQLNGKGINEPHLVATGRYHGCASYEGRVYCYGYGRQGQLGDGNGTTSEEPVAVYAISGKTTDVSAGKYFSCAVVDGGAKCWGQNNYGQLGNNDDSNNVAPVPVHNLSSGVTQIASDYYHSCAVANGAAKCWGANWYGALGNDHDNHRDKPVQVEGLTSGVKQVAAGQYHSCALLDNGTVKCWGLNNYGQLGTGNKTKSLVPLPVVGLSNVIHIEAGGHQTCAIREGGALLCWGRNTYGELGDGTTTHRTEPTPVKYMSSGVTKVATGPYHTCAIKNERAKCWGWNANGNLGNGETATREKKPVEVTGSQGITDIDVHYAYSCGVIDGRTHCWGAGGHGRLGNGKTHTKKVPFPVTPMGAFQ